jgi:uncharacterized protein
MPLEDTMKFAVVYTYPEDKSAIAEARPRHREYLSSLSQQGKLHAAGPFAGDAGALIIYETESQDEVEALIAADPFRAAGVFASWTVHPWTKVF